MKEREIKIKFYNIKSIPEIKKIRLFFELRLYVGGGNLVD